MKKCFLIIILFLFLSVFSVEAVSLSNVIEIEPEAICSIKRNSSKKIMAMQGVYFYSSKYAIYTGYVGDKKNAYLTLVDLKKCEVLDLNGDKVLGHGNDITYDSINKRFYVTAAATDKDILNDKYVYSFTIKNKKIVYDKKIQLPVRMAGFAYDSEQNRFISYNGKNLYSVSSLTSKAKVQKINTTIAEYDGIKFSRQGLAYANGKIYMARSIPNDSAVSIRNSSYILIYDAETGEYQSALHVSNKSFAGHLEGITVLGHTLYLGYNVHETPASQTFMKYDMSKMEKKNDTKNNNSSKKNAASSSESNNNSKKNTTSGSESSNNSSKKNQTKTGWQKVDNKWYYYDTNGVMKTGWQTIDNNLYYFGTDGVMRTKWQTIDNQLYYFGLNGIKRTEWQKIDERWYYFDTNGVMQTGWKKINWQSKDSWFYFDSVGVMKTGWQQIDGKWYYFDTNGVMQIGWQTIDNQLYYFGLNGIKRTEWQRIDEKWYYFDTNGVMQTGWKKINWQSKDSWFYFGTDGVMKTGWQKIDNKWYYLSANGVMQTGWQKLEWEGKTDWYYFESNGAMVSNKCVTIKGSEFCFSKSGRCISGNGC